MAQLVQQESKLSAFEALHFAGHWDSDGTMMIQAIRAATRDPLLRAHAFPWPLLTVLSPFVTLFREMREMRYLWSEPLRLDNQRLVSVLGSEPRTPLEQAVRTTLAGLDCLPNITESSHG
jgi:nucleoside-diphosphate-sugar epimerase